jgi:hypothetical protein
MFKKCIFVFKVKIKTQVVFLECIFFISAVTQPGMIILFKKSPTEKWISCSICYPLNAHCRRCRMHRLLIGNRLLLLLLLVMVLPMMPLFKCRPADPIHSKRVSSFSD